jgi:hypothetical protein
MSSGKCSYRYITKFHDYSFIVEATLCTMMVLFKQKSVSFVTFDSVYGMSSFETNV